MINSDLISFEIPNSSEIYFSAELSNGQIVHQDTREKGEHAWVRLSRFMKDNPDLSIKCLTVTKPNGKKHECPKDQKGYCFGYKKIKTFLGPQREIDLIGFGYFDGEVCYFKWLNQNAKVAVEEKRTKKTAGFFLIENI